MTRYLTWAIGLLVLELGFQVIGAAANILTKYSYDIELAFISCVTIFVAILLLIHCLHKSMDPATHQTSTSD